MKFRPGYLALAPLAPLGAAVAHAVLMPKKNPPISRSRTQTAPWLTLKSSPP